MLPAATFPHVSPARAPRLAALAFATLGLTSVAAQDLLEPLARGKPGSEHRLDAIVLEGDTAPTPMRLREVTPWTTDAVIVLHEAGGKRELAPPPARYFRGELESEPGSRAFLRFDASGEVKGLVMSAGGAWLLDGRRGKSGEPLKASALHADALHARPGGFRCEALPPPDKSLPIGTAEAASGQSATPAHAEPSAWAELLRGAAKGNAAPTYLARIAVETDHEFFQLHGNSTAAAQYMADLFAFISGIYENEVQTALAISRLDLYPTPDDPWTQTGTSCALAEVGGFWNTQRTEVNRTITHFVSGKPMGGGVAWLGVLCSGGGNSGVGNGCPGLAPTGPYFGGYGVSGGLFGSFNAANPGVVWDMVVIAHEIGHNFGSPHTHCYANLDGNAAPIDQCATEPGANCFAGPTPSLPGPPGQGSGTIMSYCHLLGGGLANISAVLGTGHAFGVQPQRVPTRMASHVATRASQAPTCLAPQNGVRLTVAERTRFACAGASTSAQGIAVEGFGAAGSPVTLGFDPALPAGVTASFTPNPVNPGASSQLQFTVAAGSAAGPRTLRLLGTAGAVVSNAVDLTLNVDASVPAVPTLLAPAASATGVSSRPTFSWQAVPGAASYRIEIATEASFAAPVLAADVVGTSYTATTALAFNTGHFWRARANNACGGSAYSAARGFTVAPQVGQCAAGSSQRVLYAEGFDTGLGGWTASTASGSGSWVASTARRSAGSGAAFSAGAPDISDRRLDSPAIALPSDLSGLGLRFDTFVAIESDTNICYDSGRLEISTDNGANYAAVPASAIQQRPLDAVVPNIYGNPLGGQQAWCGSRRSFETYLVDLGAWAGQSVRLRLRSTSDNSFNDEGWYVDAVQVLGCEAADPGVVFRNGFED